MRLWCALTMVVFFCAGAAAAAPSEEAPAVPPVAEDTLRLRADLAEGDGESNEFSATGRVRVDYLDVSLNADSLLYDADTGELTAEGQVVFRQELRWLAGRGARYNFLRREGTFTDACAGIDGMYVRGREIEVAPDRMSIVDGVATTCVADHPHYRVTARRITVVPHEYVLLKGARLWIGGFGLPAVGGYRHSLSEDRQGFGPHLGISSRDGLFVGGNTALSAERWGADTGDLNARYATRQGFRGWFTTSRLRRWGTLSLVVSRREFPGERAPIIPLTDVLVEDIWWSAQPELSVASAPRRLLGNVELVVGASAGRYEEQDGVPMRGRAAATVSLTARRRPLAPGVAVSYGAAYRHSWYEGGLTQSVLAAGGTVEWQASDRLKLGLSYYHRTPSGTTPFLFDDVQIGHEFGPSIDWRVNPRWRVAVSGRHDLSNSRWRAFDVMVARTLDCMEYGLTYSRTRREIGLHVALLNFGGGAGVVTPPICRDIMPSPNE